MTQDDLDLLHAYLNGTISEADFGRLQSLLRENPAARRMLRSLSTVEAKWQELAAMNPETLRVLGEPVSRAAESNRRSDWLQWRPLTAAAAGIAVGLFCASMAWAIASPRAVATAERLFALVGGGFETGVAGSGFPRQVGGWSGDASEIVVADSVKAREGQKMLRFVKAEGDANAQDGRAMACDVFQLVDLRPLRANLSAAGDSLLELSANFLDARPKNTKPSVTFFCQIFLLKGDARSVYQTWPNNIAEAIASGSAQVTTLGGDGGAWKQLTAKSLVSAEADFAVVQISARPNQRVPIPPGLFVDDVKLTLKTQPSLPVRVVQR